MSLYTRTGDDGSTALFGGDRVPKSHARLEAYGTVDELNAMMGLLALQVSGASDAAPVLDLIQRDLFALGALLATPPAQQEKLHGKMAGPAWPLSAMEADIDRLEALAPPLKTFVLPGGCPAAVQANLARTVCRRAERAAVALAAMEPVPPLVLAHLNRLSDWLFALARAENALAGIPDRAWRP